MDFSTFGRRRQGHESAQLHQLRLEEMETAEATEEEAVEKQIQLHTDEVNRDLHSPSVSSHEAVETQSVSSSSSFSSSPSYYSSFSSSSVSFSTTTLPMRYSRRRRRAANPRAVSMTDNFFCAQQSLLLQASSSSQAHRIAPSSSSSTSLSPASSPVGPCHSFDSCSSSSPPLLPRTANIPSAQNNMLAVAGPSQHAPSFRGRKRYAAIGSGHPIRGSKEVHQQPASQFIPWWKHWESVAVNLGNVPMEATTFTIWNAFRKEGNVFSIDLFEDGHGNKESRGKIRFRCVLLFPSCLFPC